MLNISNTAYIYIHFNSQSSYFVATMKTGKVPETTEVPEETEVPVTVEEEEENKDKNDKKDKKQGDVS